METNKDPITPILERLDMIIQAQSLPLNDTLWSVEDIARWSQLSASTVSQHVITRDDFPAHAFLTGRKVGANRRYFAAEVIDYVRRNRGKLPRPSRATRCRAD